MRRLLPILVVLCTLMVLGSWAGEVPIPNPDHEFSDDQLAKWLTAPSSGNTAEDFAEDEWHEGTGDNGMVVLSKDPNAHGTQRHRHLKVHYRPEHDHAQMQHSQPQRSEPESTPMQRFRYAGRQLSGPNEEEQNTGGVSYTRQLSGPNEEEQNTLQRAVFVPADANFKRGSEWWKDEVKYVKVETFVILMICCLAILAMLLINFVRSFMRTCGSNQGIRDDYAVEISDAPKKKKEAAVCGCMDHYGGLPTKGVPVPNGAAHTNDLLFKRFCMAIFTLVVVAIVCYAMWEAGVLVHFVAVIQTDMHVDITRGELVHVFIDMFVHLALAIFLLYAMLSFAVVGCLGKQKALRRNDCKKEKKILDLCLKDGLCEESDSLLGNDEEAQNTPIDVDTFDYARYMAICIDDTIALVSELTITSWVALGVFDVILWSVITYAKGVDANVNRGIQIGIGLLVPFLGLALWILVLSKHKEQLEKSAKKNPKEASEDVISKTFTCCASDGSWPVIALQAMSFVTCYTIARIVAARKTYHAAEYGAELWAIMLVLGVFLFIFFLQVWLMYDLTRKCAVVFNLPPYISTKHKALIKRVATASAENPQFFLRVVLVGEFDTERHDTETFKEEAMADLNEALPLVPNQNMTFVGVEEGSVILYVKIFNADKYQTESCLEKKLKKKPGFKLASLKVQDLGVHDTLDEAYDVTARNKALTRKLKKKPTEPDQENTSGPPAQGQTTQEEEAGDHD